MRLAHQLLISPRIAVHVDPQGVFYRFHKRNLALYKYYGRKDVYGSFTELPKLGFNPKSKHKTTPVGVYGYPISHIIDRYQRESFGVEYQGEAPYLHVFQVSNLDRALVFDRENRSVLDHYGAVQQAVALQSSELPDDYDELLHNLNRFFQDHYDEFDHFYLGVQQYQQKGPDSQLQSEMDEAFPRWVEELRTVTDGFDPDYIKELFETFGFTPEFIFRRGTTKFYKDAEEFTKQYLRYKPFIEMEEKFPYELEIKKLPQAMKLSWMEYEELKVRVLNSSFDELVNDDAFAWEMTKKLAGSNTRLWTGLLRQLGLIGAIDHGTGTIHENEKFQGVFFDPASIRVLEVIDNREKDSPGKIQQRREWSRDLESGFQSALSSLSSNMNWFEKNIRKNTVNGICTLDWRALENMGSDLKTIQDTLAWLYQHRSQIVSMDYGPAWEDLQREILGRLYLYQELEFGEEAESQETGARGDPVLTQQIHGKLERLAQMVERI
jgi:hypothetical protein